MKKLSLIFVFAVLTTISGAQVSSIGTLSTSSQITFHDRANMNTPRSLISCAASADNIYVCSGMTNVAGVTSEIERYNIATNSWSTFANSTFSKRYTSSEIVGNKLYLFNGSLINGTVISYNDKMEVIDLSTGTITFSTNNPNPVEQSGSAVWNNKIYVFGGANGTINSNRLLSFDTSTQTWTELASMPEAKTTKGEIINGKLYVIGGYNGVNSTRIDVYDILTNTWTFVMNMPQGISAHATTYCDSKIWIVGDYTNLTSIAYYDVVKNEFSSVENNMIARRHAGAAVANGKLYVVGGNTTSYMSSTLSSLQISVDNISAMDENRADQLKLHYDPVSSILNISGLTQNSTLTILDVSGRILKNKSIAMTQTDVSNLNKGIYIVAIEDKYERTTLKFIKN